MRKYVIMGVQGSGKGTQAKLLCERSTWSTSASATSSAGTSRTTPSSAAQVRRTMAAGELVGDDLVEAVVRERLDRHDWNYGFIVDGFPRNGRQAEFFLESYDIDGVIHLDLPDEEVRRRVLARRLCSRCGLDYNLIASRPAVADTCDVCGGALVAREDDTPEALEVRLREYHEQDPAGARHLPAQGVRRHGRRDPVAGGGLRRDPPPPRPARGERLTAVQEAPGERPAVHEAPGERPAVQEAPGER